MLSLTRSSMAARVVRVSAPAAVRALRASPVGPAAQGKSRFKNKFTRYKRTKMPVPDPVHVLDPEYKGEAFDTVVAKDVEEDVICKEAWETTSSLLEEMRAVEAAAGATEEKPWQLEGATILYRQPVVRPLAPEYEIQWAAMDQDRRARNSVVYPRGFMKEGDPAPVRYSPEDTTLVGKDYDLVIAGDAKDQEIQADENRNKLLGAFQAASRVSPADKAGDRTSYWRSLDQFVYLVVKYKADGKWFFPKAPIKSGLTMRSCAELSFKATFGTDLECEYFSNAPIGHFPLPGSKTANPEKFTGSMVYFYKAKFFGPSVSLEKSKKYVEHAWVTRDELPEYIKDPLQAKFFHTVL